MACDITAGRDKACKQNIGGVGKLFLFNFVENPFTVTSGVATAINVALTEVFEFELEGDGNNVAEDVKWACKEAITYLKKIDAATSQQMNLLAYGFPMAVVKDRNGVYHAVGIDDGIDFTVAQTTGGAKTELNGYTLTGVSTTGALSPKLDSSTITAFLALVDY